MIVHLDEDFIFIFRNILLDNCEINSLLVFAVVIVTLGEGNSIFI